MKVTLCALCAAAVVAVVVLNLRSDAQTNPTTGLAAHATSTFELTVKAPCDVAIPLFGPEGERAWAGDDWNPRFLYPTPARAVPGAVFETGHGPHLRQWVLTTYDLKARHIEYVITFPDVLVTTLDIQFEPLGSDSTRVVVTHEWTALSPEFNNHVAAFSKMDAATGKDWEDAINHYLDSKKR